MAALAGKRASFSAAPAIERLIFGLAAIPSRAYRIAGPQSSPSGRVACSRWMVR